MRIGWLFSVDAMETLSVVAATVCCFVSLFYRVGVFSPTCCGVVSFFFHKTIVVVLLYYTNIPGKKRKPPTMLAGPNAI